MSLKSYRSYRRNEGFTFLGILGFNILVAIAVVLIGVMLWQVSQIGKKDVMKAEALSYARAKIESIQTMPFEDIKGTGRKAVGSAFDHYEYEINVNYVDGPVYPDDRVRWATKYKNITVIIYHKDIPVQKLASIRVSRK